MDNNFNLKKFLVENKLTTNSKIIKKYLAEGRLFKENQNPLPLDIIQDMYSVASTVDQGYESDHDMKGAGEKEKKYQLQYPKEYNFINDVFTYDEYAGPGDKPVTDEKALEVVGYTLDQIRGI
jgi:hypothetical protein